MQGSPQRKVTAGDRVEYTPTRPGTPHYGESGTVLTSTKRESVVRFDDGSEQRVFTCHLSWIPHPNDLEAEKDWLQAEHLRQKRGSRGPMDAVEGRPHEAHEPEDIQPVDED